MTACKTSLTARDVPPEVRPELRGWLEKAVPHGRTDDGGANDRGAWGAIPEVVEGQWSAIEGGYAGLVARHPKLATRFTPSRQLGTLGTGNHFLEVCLDTDDAVWVMLHSGSRGVGARIGGYFTKLAQEECTRWFVSLPDKALAYLAEGAPAFEDYMRAVGWAQDYAKRNRALMMQAALRTLQRRISDTLSVLQEIDCHHNYVAKERHFGRDILVTRKGAIRAREGDWGIIPGSMGARSFIVRGKGNPDAFCSASHGAGRKMSRTEAKRTFSLEDHAAAVAGIECRRDADVLDETPGAYKDIDAVMAAQASLVEPVTELRQIVCVKG
jgi:tRNA-splicing ligase RtcB